MDGKKIIGLIQAVTKKWARQRKAEERSAANAARRYHVLVRSSRTTIKDVAWEVMPEAYQHASSNHTLPAHARQIMYAARGPIQEVSGQVLDDQYFTQTLLPNYLLANPESTADWDVVFDARGHFAEPHTGVIIPLGTLDVREYLRELAGQGQREQRGRHLFPVSAKADRFRAVLFVEKEGFLPLFQRVRLAERFDLAIMSTKGVSVTAARRLVDEFSGQGIPCLVLRDFDKAGFTIVRTLRADGRRYKFRHPTRVIDLGLRLADVEQNDLLSEEVSYGESDPTANLWDNGATEEEIAFLCGGRGAAGYGGRRVELNAFASGDLVRWIEGKLETNGVKKVVPSQQVLVEAYRRAYERQVIRKALREIRRDARTVAAGVIPPDDLESRVREELQQRRTISWDRAVAEIAAGEADR
jgi:hypothetical protein